MIVEVKIWQDGTLISKHTAELREAMFVDYTPAIVVAPQTICLGWEFTPHIRLVEKS